jgi:low affinity Fe/Cu permease
MFAGLAALLSRWMGSHLALLVTAVLAAASLLIFGVGVTSVAIAIATLLMVLVLQNAENRHLAALHVKLDEIITHLEGPRDSVAGIEDRSHEEIEELRESLEAPATGHAGDLPEDRAS